MKKLVLTSFVLIAIQVTLKAQIPDYSFECWNTFPGGYEEPCGWTTLNGNSQFGYPIFVVKTTDAHTDSFAMKVTTMGYINPIPPFNSLVDIGLARTGNDYQNGVTGFRDTIRHTSFGAWVKYAPLGGQDSAEIKIKLYRWNAAQGYEQDMAEAKFYVKTNDTAYHCMTAQFTYFSPFISSGNPDTACVYVSSSQLNDSTAGSFIKIDEIWYGNCNPTSVNETVHNLQSHIYPNPASDQVSFTSLPAGADRIKLFEITGKIVAVEAVSGSRAMIDVKVLTPGIYFYGVYDDDNKVVSSGKFSVVR